MFLGNWFRIFTYFRAYHIFKMVLNKLCIVFMLIVNLKKKKKKFVTLDYIPLFRISNEKFCIWTNAIYNVIYEMLIFLINFLFVCKLHSCLTLSYIVDAIELVSVSYPASKFHVMYCHHFSSVVVTFVHFPVEYSSQISLKFSFQSEI